MSYVAPDAVLESMVNAAATKGRLPVKQLLLRGFLSGALLGFATTLAITASLQTGAGIVGALVFPAGFVIIVLLGLELVTGNFAVVPLGVIERRITTRHLASNWGWVFLGNLVGSVFYAALFFATVHEGTPLAEQVIRTAEAKTLAYEGAGTQGMLEVFAKAILCNWMVTLGVVMAFTATTTSGKVLGMWLPIVMFFAQGFEHAVVNMFVIPLGMLLGADISVAQWWGWNQIPVTLGNLVGGLVFTGLALYAAQRKRPPSGAPVAATVPAGVADPVADAAAG